MEISKKLPWRMTMTKVKNDLYDYGLSIIQDADAFKFSLDSILLAEFVHFRLTDRKIFDFCTGNAAIPLILSTKTKKKITGVEVQPYIYELAKESVATNGLEQQIELVQESVQSYSKKIEGQADVIICNPPYFKVTKMINANSVKACARHEILLTMHELVVSIARALKSHGQFFLVYDPSRLTELLVALKEKNLAVKKICFVYSNAEKDAMMVMVQGLKDGNDGVVVSKPVIAGRKETYQNIFK